MFFYGKLGVCFKFCGTLRINSEYIDFKEKAAIQRERVDLCIKEYTFWDMQFDELKLCKSYETYNISDLPKFYDYDLVIVIIGAEFFFTKPF